MAPTFEIIPPKPSIPPPLSLQCGNRPLKTLKILGLADEELDSTLKEVGDGDLWRVCRETALDGDEETQLTTDELFRDPFACELLDDYMEMNGYVFKPSSSSNSHSDTPSSIPRHHNRNKSYKRTILSDEEETDTDEMITQVLRGTRSRGRQRSERYDNNYSEDEEEEEETNEEETSEYGLDENSYSPKILRKGKPTRKSTRTTSNAKYVEHSKKPGEYEPRIKSERKERVRRKKGQLAKSFQVVEEVSREGEEAGSPFRHKSNCNKCGGPVASVLLKAYMKKKVRKTRAKNKTGWTNRGTRSRMVLSTDGDEEEDTSDMSEEEIGIRGLGAWVTCRTCCSANHWGCLPHEMKREAKENFGKRVEDEIEWLSIMECKFCRKDGGICKTCKIPGAKVATEEDGEFAKRDVQHIGVMFRCEKCFRPAHYGCLPPEDDGREPEFALDVAYYQKNWLCNDCKEYSPKTDYILAWRYADLNDMRNQAGWMTPDIKDEVDVEYLVKFEHESFRQVRWVPHAVMKAVHPAKLRNFLKTGPKISYTSHLNEDIAEDDEEKNVDKKQQEKDIVALPPVVDAESKIPKLWKTVDRILDVFLVKNEWDSSDGTSVEDLKNIPNDPLKTWDRVKSFFVKWCDLDYSQCSWHTTVPKEGDEDYESFLDAYGRYLRSRDVKIPRITADQMTKLNRPRHEKTFAQAAFTTQPEWLEGGRLMDFQLEGVNWMYHKWWVGESGILGDEMGLGKTIQVISFISILKNREARQPFLVIVPNSTISNWVREFEKWAPDVRVVPYFGLEKSRKRIEKYELFPASNGFTLRAHVVISTYESFVQNMHVFRKVQRWEALIVDEGQRLKAGDTSQSARELAHLPVGRRFLMTGTPVNNNIRELLNLLNFLDPENWPNVEETAKEYEELDQTRIEKLRESLRPYLLRRTKESVLDLPPLTEIIVPLSISPLQREIYKSLLTNNAAVMEAITAKTNKTKSKVSKANLNNLLMQLRKCLGHPYLVSPDIEPTELTPEQERMSLVEASAKFVLLRQMLPKLKQRGHRVLLFTQFKIVLDILETFLSEEKISYLRLDGNTPQEDRQKGIDLFNKPGSPIDIYMLSTRAGGVGINLTTADTVIIYDSDWNPHQDLQAIARAHRIGQKKPVKVFRLMIKNTCEEKIMAAGRRKLALDHLIVKRINAVEDAADDVESILQFGAKALFEDKQGGEEDIKYTDEDIDKLLDRSDVEAKSTSKEGVHKSSFAFAKVWELKKDALDEVDESAIAATQEDIESTRGFWSNILREQEATQKKAKADEILAGGKGKRKRIQRVELNKRVFDGESDAESPVKKNKRRKKNQKDDENFQTNDSSGSESENGSSVAAINMLDEGDAELLNSLRHKKDISKQEKKERKALRELKRMEEERKRAALISQSQNLDDLPPLLPPLPPLPPLLSNSNSYPSIPTAIQVSEEQMQRQCQIIRGLIETQNIKDPTVSRYLSKASMSFDPQKQIKYIRKATKALIELTPQGMPGLPERSIKRPSSSRKDGNKNIPLQVCKSIDVKNLFRNTSNQLEMGSLRSLKEPEVIIIDDEPTQKRARHSETSIGGIEGRIHS